MLYNFFCAKQVVALTNLLSDIHMNYVFGGLVQYFTYAGIVVVARTLKYTVL